MKKLMLLVAMLVLVMMLATPALAQNDKAAKQAQKAAKAEAKAAKAQKGDKMKEMPKTGGFAINTSLLGLGAGALLVGGGLLVRKATR